jgi:hypothetical protein
MAFGHTDSINRRNIPFGPFMASRKLLNDLPRRYPPAHAVDEPGGCGNAERILISFHFVESEQMPSPPSATPVAEATITDSAPLTTEIVDELSARLAGGDAVALRDPDNKVFAVLLSPPKFDLLQVLSDLAGSGRLVLEPKQTGDSTNVPTSLVEYIERLEK